MTARSGGAGSRFGRDHEFGVSSVLCEAKRETVVQRRSRRDPRRELADLPSDGAVDLDHVKISILFGLSFGSRPPA